MRPCFSYYGSKYKAAKFLGEPRRDLVIEPFAGSACYSLFFNCPNVKLYDKYDAVCSLWDFLIKSSIKDIRSIPDDLDPECTNDLTIINGLPSGAQLLVQYWIGYASDTAKRRSLKTYNTYKGAGCSVWGKGVKNRIISAKPLIKNWTIENLSYEQIPNEDAHWHIDPPYNNDAGAKYRHGANAIDYDHLGEWCKERLGAVQVCENEGADWLPFGDPYTVLSASRYKKPSREVIYQQGFVPIKRDLFVS